MVIISYLRLAAGLLCLLAGLVLFAIQLYGVFHMKYVLNRMHSAAVGDTLAISLSLIGLMILCGINFDTLKMSLILVFLWFSSPVSSHMIAKMEYGVNPENEGVTYNTYKLEEVEKQLEDEKKTDVSEIKEDK